MNSSIRSVAAGVLAVLFFLSAANGMAQSNAKPEADCYRVRLKGSLPHWISSATWVARSSEIGIVDPLQNSLLFVSSAGEVRPFNRGADLKQSMKDFLPATFESTRQGYVLKMVDPRMYFLDQNLNLVRQGDLSKQSAGAQGKVASLYDWIVAGDYMVAYGSVSLASSERHRFGFFRAPLQNLSSFDFLREYPIGDYYLLGHKYLAGLGDDAYFVLMDKQASIFQIPADGKGHLRELSVFPAKYRTIPPLATQSTGPSSDEALYREIEGLTIPVGLYGQDGFLYLLTREPAQNSGTNWYLHKIKIDPKGDQLVGKVKLPTSSHHVTVVPSEGRWFIFERGIVDSIGSQEIPSIVSIATTAVRSLTLPEACPDRQ